MQLATNCNFTEWHKGFFDCTYKSGLASLNANLLSKKYCEMQEEHRECRLHETLLLRRTEVRGRNTLAFLNYQAMNSISNCEYRELQW
jgi:hypothetical protein